MKREPTYNLCQSKVIENPAVPKVRSPGQHQRKYYMMRNKRFPFNKLSTLFLLVFALSCKLDPKPQEVTDQQQLQEDVGEIQTDEKGVETEAEKPLWIPYDDSDEIAASATHENPKMRFKLLQSKVLDKNLVFQPLADAVAGFSMDRYETLRPLVMEQDIPTLQKHIKQGVFSYEELTLFFLQRIYTYELPHATTLNTILALNPDVLEQARSLDANADGHHPIYGMPILLKDNIGAARMKTTAGAIALMGNETENAFIVERLKANGALILGKVNLSEWANYLCNCPNGQSAYGGQTLNPYGRRIFDTGGSSAGSGTAVAANYAVAAVGTETSGSILSPSGQNSVVGMKPTIGLLSRSGIVPISSTLDTPGPMTKSVIDNGIVLDAMRGFDETDDKSVQADWEASWYQSSEPSLKGKRLGVFKSYLEKDTLYRSTIGKLEQAGAIIVAFEAPEVAFDGFLSLLNGDMKFDLPRYFKANVKDTAAVPFSTVADIVAFNLKDSLVRIPYGQVRLEGILGDSLPTDSLQSLKGRLKNSGRTYWNTPMTAHRLDAILSINNYDAGAAAVAEYPALGLPMGYRYTGEPVNLTLIARQYQEGKLYALGAAIEELLAARRMPAGYED